MPVLPLIGRTALSCWCSIACQYKRLTLLPASGDASRAPRRRSTWGSLPTKRTVTWGASATTAMPPTRRLPSAQLRPETAPERRSPDRDPEPRPRTPCFGGSTKRWLPALPRFLATVGPGWRSTDLTLYAGGEDNAKGPPTVRRHAGWRVLFFAWPQRPALARRA